MQDQNNGSLNEQISPEHVSLEKRFGVQDNQSVQNTVEQEIMPENVQETIAAQNDNVYAQILSKVQSQPHTDHASVTQDASALHQISDRESQVSHLLDLAMTKGVVHAVKVAQQVEDYYVLDQLHDRMRAEDFHQALIARGLIE